MPAVPDLRALGEGSSPASRECYTPGMIAFDEFQKKDRFSREEVAAFARGSLLSDAPKGLPGLPDYLLLPFHEVVELSWDAASGKGRIVAVKRNALDDWYYGCHFLGDPVMPGCWGVDGVWQCLAFFAAWRGLSGCDRSLGMEDVRFSGQIRPYDKEVRYALDIVSIEAEGTESLITAKAEVAVDGQPVYSIGSAMLGTAFWDAEGQKGPAQPPPVGRELSRPLSHDEFAARSSFSLPEVIAISLGKLVKDAPGEMGLLPDSLMLGVSEVHEISFDEASGEGRVLASQRNEGLEWFYPMARGEKPSAFTIDSVWQLMGLFLAWRKASGTGRALGFEKAEVFDAIRPEDRGVLYEVSVRKLTRVPAGDTFVTADARVFAAGRLIMAVTGARVGCHTNIRYSDYPVNSEMSTGGKLKTRA